MISLVYFVCYIYTVFKSYIERMAEKCLLSDTAVPNDEYAIHFEVEDTTSIEDDRELPQMIIVAKEYVNSNNSPTAFFESAIDDTQTPTTTTSAIVTPPISCATSIQCMTGEHNVRSLFSDATLKGNIISARRAAVACRNDDDELNDGVVVGNDLMLDDNDDDDDVEIIGATSRNIRGSNEQHEKVDVFLETPVVADECQSVVVMNGKHQYGEKCGTGKPKRLSDEFFSADDGENDDFSSIEEFRTDNVLSNLMSSKRSQGPPIWPLLDRVRTAARNSDVIGLEDDNEDINDNPTNTRCELIAGNEGSNRGFDRHSSVVTTCNVHKNMGKTTRPENGVSSEPNHRRFKSATSQFENNGHLFGIEVSLSQEEEELAAVGSGSSQAKKDVMKSPNSSFREQLEEQLAAFTNSVIDVQSIDEIERHEFEIEQQMTGGVIVHNRSLVCTENRLNQDMLNAMKQNETSEQQEIGHDCDNEIPTHSTTPTSSRTTSSAVRSSESKTSLISKHSLAKSFDKATCYCDDNGCNNCKSSEIESMAVNGENVEISEDTLFNWNSTDSQSSSDKLILGTSDKLLSDITVWCSTSGEPENLSVHNSAVDTAETKTKRELVKSSNQSLPSTSAASSSSSFASRELNNCQHSSVTTSHSSFQDESDVALATDFSTSKKLSSEQWTMNKIASTEPKPSTADGKNASTDNDVVVVPVIRPSLMRQEPPNNTNLLLEQIATDRSQIMKGVENDHDYDEEAWADCEEFSDIEEICTCRNYTDEEGCASSEDELPSKDVDLSGYTHMSGIFQSSTTTPHSFRKRKFTETRTQLTTTTSETSTDDDSPSTSGRKRLALEGVVAIGTQLSGKLSPATSPKCANTDYTAPATTTPTSKKPLSRYPTLLDLVTDRCPRSMIPTPENPPPELNAWLLHFQRWSHAERLVAIDRMIDYCEPTQVRHIMKVIEPQFQRDFISLLPKELALQVLSFLRPVDLLSAAQTCRTWRFLCDDNLLWREKCKHSDIIIDPITNKPKRGRAGSMPYISSPWKAAYLRQYIIEMNWRARNIRTPKYLKGHDDHVITCLQFCGNRIVSGSDDNTLKVWSAVSGKCLKTLIGHTGGVWSSQMADNVIISGSTDRTLKVWNADTGQCTHTLYGHTSTVRCMHLHGNKVVSGSRDATLRVWNINGGICLHVLVGHLAAVRCVQYDGKLVVSGAYDYMVKVWNPELEECLHTLQGHTNRVYSLQFDGIHVVSGSLDTSIRVWDVENGNCKHTLMGHQSLTSGMELRSNILVSGNADSTVKVWDITTGQCLQTLSGPNKHQSAVTCLLFNSRFVITSSDDGTVKLWDVQTGNFIRNLIVLESGGSGGVVWRIRANDTKLICAVGSRNGTEETKLMVLDFDVEGACEKCS